MVEDGPMLKERLSEERLFAHGCRGSSVVFPTWDWSVGFKVSEASSELC